MTFTIAEDLKTLLIANFDHTNVGTIAADPNIKLIEDDRPATKEANGIIEIGQERLVRSDSHGSWVSKTFIVDITISYPSNTSTVLKKIVSEIERVVDAESIAHTSYFYRVKEYVWTGAYREGTMDIRIEVLDALQDRAGL